MIRPWMFPVAEVLLFLASAALAGTTPVLSWSLLALAAWMQSLALHIYFHETVHHPFITPPRFRARFPGNEPREVHEAVLTLLMGLPFEGYRWHHLDHHRHENSLDDPSSTWKPGPDGSPTPTTWWGYALTWPLQTVRVSRRIRSTARRDIGAWVSLGRMKRQQGLIALFLIVLGCCGSSWLLRYVLLTYCGWFFTSVHNHGQHPPVRGHGMAPTSFHHALYNRIFCNNGLHFEHHRQSGIPWHALAPDPRAPRIATGHLLAPLSAKPVETPPETRSIAC